uniref:Outer dense fiber protein 3 n=1 Tax=Hemiselmis tepida TaxID=464990 RepID=A0A7S0W906_9CRYP|mmetsp:Transcript_608/g.1525  ORF Transcript_608/g.1525 Transcript_608/m.1525 type:complete len:289 (+) Transcript_608:453-1319(+)
MGVKQKSPGPAAYTIQNTVGADTPAFSFGSMKRPSPGGLQGISPGPVYQLKTSVGRNKDLIFRHNPSHSFGTMERPDPAGINKLHRSPGPGEYKLGSVVGPTKPPAYKSAPSFGFGTSARLPGDPHVPKRLDRATLEKLNSTHGSHAAGMGQATGQTQEGAHDPELEATPGPGHYDGQSWRKKKPPAYSFGTTAQRPSASTRATRVPGPGKYKPGETTGDATMPTLRKNPAFGFGTARGGSFGRSTADDSPGPGSYVCPSAFGKQAGARRSLPRFSFGTSPRETGIYD